jgi:hypothetical protein
MKEQLTPSLDIANHLDGTPVQCVTRARTKNLDRRLFRRESPGEVSSRIGAGSRTIKRLVTRVDTRNVVLPESPDRVRDAVYLDDVGTDENGPTGRPSNIDARRHRVILTDEEGPYQGMVALEEREQEAAQAPKHKRARARRAMRSRLLSAESDMNAIDITAIVPTFRRPTQLVETVRSPLAQSGVAVEVRVIDDSPEGSAREAVESIGDARVTYTKRATPTRGRPAIVRNDAWPLARGRYIHFLDDTISSSRVHTERKPTHWTQTRTRR